MANKGFLQFSLVNWWEKNIYEAEKQIKEGEQYKEDEYKVAMIEEVKEDAQPNEFIIPQLQVMFCCVHLLMNRVWQ